MFEMHPIGHVLSSRMEAADAYEAGQEVCIELIKQMGLDALDGIEGFSHAIVIFYLDRVDPIRISRGSRHVLNNPELPKAGIFAQYSAHRPNRIGTAVVRIRRHEGRKLYVTDLKALHNTPVLDIKPIIEELLPQTDLRQPPWAHELSQSLRTSRPQAPRQARPVDDKA